MQSVLSELERNALIEAVESWASVDPEHEVMGFGTGKMLTARELAEALRVESEDGVAFMATLENGVRHDGLVSVVERFQRSAQA
jgi:hypothetical protein